MALALLGLLLGVCLPLVLCMPLPTDAALYDLQAHAVMRGGVLYRDLFEPNLPGAVWIHMLVRGALGESSVALRAFDWLWLSGTIVLLSCLALPRGRALVQHVCLALLLVFLYGSVSEWNHCQRDLWMLLPGLAGLTLRARQLARFNEPHAGLRRIATWSALEGAVWGAGFWIKPFIAVPALCCWLLCATLVRRRIVLADLWGLLAGGGFVGLLGIAWLQHNGAWPYFLQTLLEWNPDYAAARTEGWTFLRVAGPLYRFFPWVLLHAVAVPAAVWRIAQLRRSTDHTRSSDESRLALLAMFYLGWLAQSLLLQHVFDYVHFPGLLLAIAVLASLPLTATRGRCVAVASFLIVAAACSPLLRVERLSCWWPCVTEGSTPEVRERLALLKQVEWQNLADVASYVDQLHLADRELTCFNSTLVYLYEQLGLEPSSRYVFLDSVRDLCRSHAEEIEQAVATSPQRYVVADLVAAGLPPQMLSERDAQAPLQFSAALEGTYPWSHEVVFRRGRYVVFRVEGPMGPMVVAPLNREAGDASDAYASGSTDSAPSPSRL